MLMMVKRGDRSFSRKSISALETLERELGIVARVPNVDFAVEGALAEGVRGDKAAQQQAFSEFAIAQAVLRQNLAKARAAIDEAQDSFDAIAEKFRGLGIEFGEPKPLPPKEPVNYRAAVVEETPSSTQNVPGAGTIPIYQPKPEAGPPISRKRGRRRGAS